jgi:hypothetical protein
MVGLATDGKSVGGWDGFALVLYLYYALVQARLNCGMSLSFDVPMILRCSSSCTCLIASIAILCLGLGLEVRCWR